MIFRAKYVVIIFEGAEMVVLLPAAATRQQLPSGNVVTAGECELHTLGSGGLGFTVGHWVLRCRGEQDARLLDKTFLPEARPHE